MIVGAGDGSVIRIFSVDIGKLSANVAFEVAGIFVDVLDGDIVCDVVLFIASVGILLESKVDVIAADVVTADVRVDGKVVVNSVVASVVEVGTIMLVVVGDSAFVVEDAFTVVA
jgi:hypothetical protein